MRTPFLTSHKTSDVTKKKFTHDLSKAEVAEFIRPRENRKEMRDATEQYQSVKQVPEQIGGLLSDVECTSQSLCSINSTHFCEVKR
jgi:hypothetical protein